MNRVKPWQKLPTFRCVECGQQATKRIEFGPLELTADGHGPNPRLRTFACDEHYRQTMDRLTDQWDGCVGEPLRNSWKRWLLRTPPLRPLDDLLIGWHNFRFYRKERRDVGW